MDGPGYRHAVQAARDEFAHSIPAVMSAAAGVPFEVCGVQAEAAGAPLAGEGGVFLVPLMGIPVTVTYPDGVAFHLDQEAGIEITVVVLHYLSRSAGPLDLDDPLRYGRLHDAAAYAEAFHTHAEVPLMRHYGTDGAGFVQAVRRVGGRPWESSAGRRSRGAGPADSGATMLQLQPALPDASILWEVPFLPHLPVGLRLGLAEDGLPADCVMLFPRRAGFVHAAEDLAVCGELLADRMLERAGH
jgi:hypothetical protein